MLLFGGSGRLGSAISAAARCEGRQVTTVPTSQLDLRELPDLLVRLAGVTGLDVVIANGLTDPRLDPAALVEANATLPLEVARLALAVPAARVLTIGTVMEHYPELAAGNAYIASKRALSAGLAALARSAEPGRLAHMRIHTLYGGRPHPHMFLGQLFAALEAGRSFAMSHGMQRREYHHVSDVGRSTLALLERMPASCELTLSHGKPMRLRDLARTIFSAFGQEHLLNIGELDVAAGEDRLAIFASSPDWLLGAVRDPWRGVVDWAAEVLGRRPVAQPAFVPQQ